MEDRAAIRQLLLRARTAADANMVAIRSAEPLTYPFLREQLDAFVLKKFLLTEADRPADDDFTALAERSLAKSMQVHPSLVEEFDTAQSCDGATSVMAKKVLLLLSIQRALGVELPALESARVKTMEDLSRLVWNTLLSSPQWTERLQRA